MEELQHPVGCSMGYPPPVSWGAVREGREGARNIAERRGCRRWCSGWGWAVTEEHAAGRAGTSHRVTAPKPRAS